MKSLVIAFTLLTSVVTSHIVLADVPRNHDATGSTIVVRDKSKKCDIRGLHKVAVVRALWEASKVAPAARRFTPDLADRTTISDEDIEDALADGYIDYLNCRVMKVDLREDSFDTTWYNRDNGDGAAERVVDSLRKR